MTISKHMQEKMLAAIERLDFMYDHNRGSSMEDVMEIWATFEMTNAIGEAAQSLEIAMMDLSAAIQMTGFDSQERKKIADAAFELMMSYGKGAL